MNQSVIEKSSSIQNVATGWMMVDNAEEVGRRTFRWCSQKLEMEQTMFKTQSQRDATAFITLSESFFQHSNTHTRRHDAWHFSKRKKKPC